MLHQVGLGPGYRPIMCQLLPHDSGIKHLWFIVEFYNGYANFGVYRVYRAISLDIVTWSDCVGRLISLLFTAIIFAAFARRLTIK